MELGGLWWTSDLNSALPHQRHRPDTWLEHEDPVSTRLIRKGRKKERRKERKKEREKERKKENNKIK